MYDQKESVRMQNLQRLILILIDGVLKLCHQKVINTQIPFP